MSEPDIYADMKPCKHCGHKMPTVAQIAGKPPRNTGGDADADKTYFGLCVNPTCFARGPEAGSKDVAVQRWNERVEDKRLSEPETGRVYYTPQNTVDYINALSSLSPWQDASETPQPCRLCVVQTSIYHFAYWDGVRLVWRTQDGVSQDKWEVLRWQYLNTGATP